MRYPHVLSSAIIAAAAASLVNAASAAVVTFGMPADPQYTTVPQSPPPSGGFANDGIWLTMTNGTPLIISDNSFPGYVDGQYQLRTVSYTPAAGEAVVQGLIGNGNDIAVEGSGSFPNNPAYLPVGSTVGPASAFVGGSSFTALSGNFGNWISASPLRGGLGVKFANGADTHYGFIDITQQTDGTITLHGYAYNSVPGEAITTFAVPEPGVVVLLAAGLPVLGWRLWRRRAAA